MAGKGKRRKKGDEKRRGRSGLMLKGLYVIALVAVGAGVGVVLGAVTETPRVVLTWLRGPVERVEVGPAVVDVDDTPLEEFNELQARSRAPKSAKTAPKSAKTAPKSAKEAPKSAKEAPKPAAPAVSAAPSKPPPVLDPAPKRRAPKRRAPKVLPAPKVRPAPRVVSEPTRALSAGARPQPRLASSPAPRIAAPAPRSPEDIMAELEARASARQRSPRDSKSSFVVQIGAHAKISHAEDQARSLRASGFDAYVSNTKPKGSRSRYRVRVRPQHPETTKELVTKLRARGFETWTTSE